MNSNATIARVEKTNHIQGERPNWILVLGGALLSILSVKIGCRLKHIFNGKQSETAKVFEKTKVDRRTETCKLHAHLYSFKQQEYSHCQTGTSIGKVEVKEVSICPRVRSADLSLPLVVIPLVESSKANDSKMWTSSQEQIEFHQQAQFHNSNSLDSPCLSDSGSDTFIKREAIHKLRQHLKKRDEMIVEMQTQISVLQNSLNDQMVHSSHLQSQLDLVNRDLFESERELQHLRKVLTDHVMAETSPRMLRTTPSCYVDANGHSNGYSNLSSGLDMPPVGSGNCYRDGERVEMLKNEVLELKEAIEGKEFLLRSYKEQKLELSSKLKEMQLRLCSLVPNIL